MIDKNDIRIFKGFKIKPEDDPTTQNNSTKSLVSKYGDTIVCFKDISNKATD